MIQALLLKIAGLSLLIILGQNPGLPPDFVASATAVANQAIAAADAQLAQPLQANAPTTMTNETTPPATPTPAQAQPSDTTVLPTAPASKARIDIVSPIPGKGLGRTYKHADEVSGEENYIVIGAVVYDVAGNPTRSSTMAVTIENQQGKKNLALEGTGDVMNVYVGDQKRQVPVYSVTYEFKTEGTHIFTFAANGLTQSVSLAVK
mgnify:CR=1 FL=1